MENNKTVIILLCVIIAILIVGIVMFSPLMAKEKSNLSISDKELNVGDSLTVKLTDENGEPIANQTVKITLTDKDGVTIDEDATTNSKGKAKLKVDEKGKYSVECKFDGDSKYASSSASGNLTVKKATTKVVDEEKTNNYDSVSGLSDDGYSYYPEYGPEVDSQGVTREYAIANNWHYIEMTVDGDRPGEYVNVGGYVPYDAKAGCYHT